MPGRSGSAAGGSAGTAAGGAGGVNASAGSPAGALPTAAGAPSTGGATELGGAGGSAGRSPGGSSGTSPGGVSGGGTTSGAGGAVIGGSAGTAGAGGRSGGAGAGTSGTSGAAGRAGSTGTLTFSSDGDGDAEIASPFNLPRESTTLNAGVTAGQVRDFTWSQSQVFPGTSRLVRVYTPSGHDGTQPAALSVLQDGNAYIDNFRMTRVLDNLIAATARGAAPHSPWAGGITSRSGGS